METPLNLGSDPVEPAAFPPELFAEIASSLAAPEFDLGNPAPPSVLELALCSKLTYSSVLPTLLHKICTSGATKKSI
jgi:hypothetical protein